MIAAASSSDDGSDSGHGASNGGTGIEAATARALQQALRAYVLASASAAAPDPEATLATAFRTLSVEARARGVSAERIVILIKALWYELPEVRAASAQRQQGLLAQAVTLCIRAYYVDADAR